MRSKVDAIYGWVTVFAGIASYLATSLGLIYEPLYIFLGLILAVGLSFLIAWAVENDFTTPLQGFCPRDIRRRRRTKGERLLAWSAFGVAAMLAVGVACYERWAIFTMAHVEEADSLLNAGYRGYGGEYGFLGLNESVVVPMSLESEDDIFNAVIRPEERTRFVITKSSTVPKVMISAIDVVVLSFDYKKPPPPEDQGPGIGAPGPMKPRVHLAYIGPEIEKGQKVFSTHYVEYGENTKVGFWPPMHSLSDDPELYEVQVISPYIGRMEYQVRVTFKYRWRSGEWFSRPRVCHLAPLEELYPNLRNRFDLPGSGLFSPSDTAPDTPSGETDTSDSVGDIATDEGGTTDDGAD